MSHVISIVTPAYKPLAEHLMAAYESLSAQIMPSGWQWQWVVQEDGQTGEVARILPDDKRISVGSGRHSGETSTRNMCLSRVTGELIKVLDADDQLTPGALARSISVLTSYPDIDWTTNSVLDLLPDGSTVGFGDDPSEGPIELGEVLTYWRSHNHRAQVHPTTLCIRRDLLFALGGWMALPSSGDTGLLLGANAVSRGYFIADVGLLYRKWPGQMTNQPGWSDPTEFPARMAIIDERARALSALWSARSSAPQRSAEHR